MKTHILLAAAVAISAFIPTASAEPPHAVVLQPQAKIKTELTLANVAAVPGEKKTIDVTLSDVAGKAVADKVVQLQVVAKSGGPALAKPITIGDVKTGANGHAVFTWSCADLKQGNFELEATYAGDNTSLAAKGSANLLVVKAQGQFKMGDLIWGTYKNEPGPASGTVIVTFNRTSDNSSLNKPVTVTMNGKSWQITMTNGFAEMALMPLDAKSWDVKFQFDGDDYTIPTAAERKYNRP